MNFIAHFDGPKLSQMRRQETAEIQKNVKTKEYLLNWKVHHPEHHILQQALQQTVICKHYPSLVTVYIPYKLQLTLEDLLTNN